MNSGSACQVIVNSPWIGALVRQTRQIPSHVEMICINTLADGLLLNEHCLYSLLIVRGF